MNWMAKARPAAPSSAAGIAPARPGPSAAAASNNVRGSNRLKVFLWLISDVPQGRILDLGPVWQSTVSFFVEKGYRVSTEDLLRTWRDFLTAEEEGFRKAPVGATAERVSPAALADKFLESALQYQE